jgi:molybdenum cofactor cytidylyltransferase
MNPVAVVLAAGASRRLGRPKQLALYRGEPLVRHATRAASAAGSEGTAVVLGSSAREIAGALGEGIVCLHNAQWMEGIASSIRAAVAWAEQRGAPALVLLLSDQPLVEARHVAALVTAWRAGARAAASVYGGAIGAPALFDASLFSELRSLRGDHGAAIVLRARRDVALVPCPEAATDIDTAADLDALAIAPQGQLSAPDTRP